MPLPLSIIIPIYNEPENIVTTLAALERAVPSEKEILLVYDREDDTTLPVVRRLQASGQRFTLVRNRYGVGVGQALRTGFEAARGEAVVVVMADGCDDLPKINEMGKLIEQGYDVVCGSRYMRGGQQLGGPWLKKLLSRTAGVSLHYLSGIPTRDITNSFKAYRREALAAIPLTPQGGFAVSMELMVKAYARGLRLTEIPVTWRERVAGQSRFRFWTWLPHYLRWYFFALFHRPSPDARAGPEAKVL